VVLRFFIDLHGGVVEAGVGILYAVDGVFSGGGEEVIGVVGVIA
jgi:hypothetical protein